MCLQLGSPHVAGCFVTSIPDKSAHFPIDPARHPEERNSAVAVSSRFAFAEGALPVHEAATLAPDSQVAISSEGLSDQGPLVPPEQHS